MNGLDLGVASVTARATSHSAFAVTESGTKRGPQSYGGIGGDGVDIFPVEIQYYQTTSERRPFEDWLDSLDTTRQWASS